MINVISPINQLGYGVAALNILKNMPKDTAFWPIGQVQVTSQEDAQIVKKYLENARLFDINAPCVKIWHQHDMAQFVGKGQRIGFPFFELDCFSEIERHNLNSLDKVLVTSGWAKKVCEKELRISEHNIRIANLGVDTNIFKPKKSQSSKTIFLNCGKWEVRKGHDVIPSIFNKAFEENDNVELWMMCDNPFLDEKRQKAWHNMYKNTKLGEKIRLIPRVNTQEEVYNIMSHSDCGLFPSRAEGWNLELIEMMACGKQVITTYYSAHTEFCNKLNSHLVEIKETEIAYDGTWFTSNIGNWAKIGEDQIDHIIEYMRSIHKLKQENRLEENAEGVKTAKRFTWKNSAEMVVNNV